MANVKKLKIIGFLSELYFYTPIFTLFLLGYGLRLEHIILAQVIYSVASLFGEIPTGYLADRFGQKSSIIAGLSLDAIGMILLAFNPSMTGLVIFFVLRGLSGAFLSGSLEALLFESNKNEKDGNETYQQAFSKVLSNGILAFICATAISGILVQYFGDAAYRPIMFMTALATMTALLLALSLRDIRGHQDEAREIRFMKHMAESGRVVLKEHTVRALTLVALLTISGEYFLRQTYQPLFQEAHVLPLFLGLTLSIGSLVNFFVVRYAFHLESFLTLDKILLLFNLLMVVGYAGLALCSSPYMLVGFYILLQGLFNAQRPIVSDYVNERIDAKKRSTVLSTISFAQSFFSIITRILLALSLGAFGLRHTLGFQALYLLVGIAIGYWYMRRCGCVHRITKHDEKFCMQECPDAFSAQN